MAVRRVNKQEFEKKQRVRSVYKLILDKGIERRCQCGGRIHYYIPDTATKEEDVVVDCEKYDLVLRDKETQYYINVLDKDEYQRDNMRNIFAPTLPVRPRKDISHLPENFFEIFILCPADRILSDVECTRKNFECDVCLSLNQD